MSKEFTCRSRGTIAHHAEWVHEDGSSQDVMICMDCGLVLADMSGTILKLISLDGIQRIIQLRTTPVKLIFEYPNTRICLVLKNHDLNKLTSDDIIAKYNEMRQNGALPPVDVEVDDNALNFSDVRQNEVIASKKYHVECTVVPSEKMGMTMEIVDDTIRITAVEPNSKADEAGVQADSVLLSINGKVVATKEEVSSLIDSSMQDGIKLRLRLISPNPPLIRPETQPVGDKFHIECEIPPSSTQKMGMVLETIDKKLRIKAIEPNSLAEAAGVQPGSTLLSVNGTSVRTQDEVIGLVASAGQANEAVRFRLLSPRLPATQTAPKSSTPKEQSSVKSSTRSKKKDVMRPLDFGDRTKRALIVFVKSQSGKSKHDPANDTLQVYWALRDALGKEQVTYLTDADVGSDVISAAPTKENILKALQWLCRCDPTDSLLLITIGDTGPDAGIMPVDASTAGPITKYEVVSALDTLPATVGVTILTDTTSPIASLGHTYQERSDIPVPICNITILGVASSGHKRRGLPLGVLSCCFTAAKSLRTANFVVACLEAPQYLLIITNYPFDFSTYLGADSQLHVGGGWFKVKLDPMETPEYANWLESFSKVYCPRDGAALVAKAKGRETRVVQKVIRKFARSKQWEVEALKKMTGLLHSALHSDVADNNAAYEVMERMLSQHIWDDVKVQYEERYSESLVALMHKRLSEPELAECTSILLSYGVTVGEDNSRRSISTISRQSSLSSVSSKSSKGTVNPPLPPSPPPVIFKVPVCDAGTETDALPEPEPKIETKIIEVEVEKQPERPPTADAGMQHGMSVHISKQEGSKRTGLEVRENTVIGVQKGSVARERGIRKGMVVVSVKDREVTRSDNVQNIIESSSMGSFSMVVADPVGGFSSRTSEVSAFSSKSSLKELKRSQMMSEHSEKHYEKVLAESARSSSTVVSTRSATELTLRSESESVASGSLAESYGMLASSPPPPPSLGRSKQPRNTHPSPTMKQPYGVAVQKPQLQQSYASQQRARVPAPFVQGKSVQSEYEEDDFLKMVSKDLEIAEGILAGLPRHPAVGRGLAHTKSLPQTTVQYTSEPPSPLPPQVQSSPPHPHQVGGYSSSGVYSHPPVLGMLHPDQQSISSPDRPAYLSVGVPQNNSSLPPAPVNRDDDVKSVLSMYDD